MLDLKLESAARYPYIVLRTRLLGGPASHNRGVTLDCYQIAAVFCCTKGGDAEGGGDTLAKRKTYTKKERKKKKKDRRICVEGHTATPFSFSLSGHIFVFLGPQSMDCHLKAWRPSRWHWNANNHDQQGVEGNRKS